MNNFIHDWKNTFKNSYLDLIYPPLCLNCEENLSKGYKILCESCFEALSFTSQEDYCKQCFSLKEGKHCLTCAKKGSPFYRLVCPLELIGPAIPLQQKLASFNTSFIAKGLAALMMRHFLQQDLPLPECIIPIHRPFFRENTTALLAKAASEILSIPLVKTITAIADKRVLLIGEKVDAEFFSAGEALIEGCPHSIVGATLFV